MQTVRCLWEKYKGRLFLIWKICFFLDSSFLNVNRKMSFSCATAVIDHSTWVVLILLGHTFLKVDGSVKIARNVSPAELIFSRIIPESYLNFILSSKSTIRSSAKTAGSITSSRSIVQSASRSLKKMKKAISSTVINANYV